MATMNFACQPYAADDPNANANSMNPNINMAIDPKNMPPEEFRQIRDRISEKVKQILKG